MSKRKPLDKEAARERRNRMLDRAADARLSLTDGVREMRAIAGMTQEEFARHRGVSARVVKAIELGQGNPTVATLNRIGAFFGLEVAFVPVKRPQDVTPADSTTTGLDGTQLRLLSDAQITAIVAKAAQVVMMGMKADVQSASDPGIANQPVAIAEASKESGPQRGRQQKQSPGKSSSTFKGTSNQRKSS
jgi:DNA-binding XRE family transcriptional regulator